MSMVTAEQESRTTVMANICAGLVYRRFLEAMAAAWLGEVDVVRLSLTLAQSQIKHNIEFNSRHGEPTGPCTIVHIDRLQTVAEGLVSLAQDRAVSLNQEILL